MHKIPFDLRRSAFIFTPTLILWFLDRNGIAGLPTQKTNYFHEILSRILFLGTDKPTRNKFTELNQRNASFDIFIYLFKSNSSIYISGDHLFFIYLKKESSNLLELKEYNSLIALNKNSDKNKMKT